MKVPEGLLLVDKPVGMSSFDVIRHLRKETGIRKMGHAGTLDPLASGLMLIGVDAGTKLLTEYVGLTKEYIAEIRIGERTTTSDQGGEVLESVSVPDIPQATLQTTLESMTGILRLPVSAYSAMKRAGVPMYKRAREAESRGEIVTDVPIRDMEVLESAFITSRYDAGAEKVNVTVRFTVGSGTYIRSLAEEYGRLLGYPAVIVSLRRTKVGDFRVEDARSL